MTKAHAKIRISRMCSNMYYWTAVVFGAGCSNFSTYYKTAAVAKRAAIRWCERVGLTHTVTVDKDIRT